MSRARMVKFDAKKVFAQIRIKYHHHTEEVYDAIARLTERNVSTVKDWFRVEMIPSEKLKVINKWLDGDIRLPRIKKIEEPSDTGKDQIDFYSLISQETETEEADTSDDTPVTTITTISENSTPYAAKCKFRFTMRKKINEDLDRRLAEAQSPEERIAVFKTYAAIYRGVFGGDGGADEGSDEEVGWL